MGNSPLQLSKSEYEQAISDQDGPGKHSAPIMWESENDRERMLDLSCKAFAGNTRAKAFLQKNGGIAPAAITYPYVTLLALSPDDGVIITVETRRAIMEYSLSTNAAGTNAFLYSILLKIDATGELSSEFRTELFGELTDSELDEWMHIARYLNTQSASVSTQSLEARRSDLFPPYNDPENTDILPVQSSGIKLMGSFGDSQNQDIHRDNILHGSSTTVIPLSSDRPGTWYKDTRSNKFFPCGTQTLDKSIAGTTFPWDVEHGGQKSPHAEQFALAFDTQLRPANARQNSAVNTWMSQRQVATEHNKKSCLNYSIMVDTPRMRDNPDIIEHMKKAQEAESSNICPVCRPQRYSLASRDTLRSHVLNCHPEVVQGKQSRTSYRCSACDMGFASPLGLRQHTTSEHRITCTQCDQTFADKRTFNSHKTHVHGPKVQCNGYVTASGLPCKRRVPNSMLAEHIRKSHSDSEFHCDKCHHKFQSKSTLNRHIIRSHAPVPVTRSAKTRITCDRCKFLFKNTESLRVHRHLDRCTAPIDRQQAQLFSCDECGMRLATAATLHQHKFTHIPNQYSCPSPNCFKVYASRRSLSDHIRISHNNHPKKRQTNSVICSTCGKSMQQQSLALHMRRTHGA